jgi:hypothetical protein
VTPKFARNNQLSMVATPYPMAPVVPNTNSAPSRPPTSCQDCYCGNFNTPERCSIFSPEATHTAANTKVPTLKFINAANTAPLPTLTRSVKVNKSLQWNHAANKKRQISNKYTFMNISF